MSDPSDIDQTTPNWTELYDLAALQSGYFTTAQAAETGISPELLIHHRKAGRVERVRRGIYRVRHFPPDEHEQLVVLWLWSKQQGVFSHDTALALHELSDILPALVHITMPASWKTRRLNIPVGVELHYADLEHSEKGWFGNVPVTNAARTLEDCLDANLTPDLLEQALDQARRRGIVAPLKLAELEARLVPNAAEEGEQ